MKRIFGMRFQYKEREFRNNFTFLLEAFGLAKHHEKLDIGDLIPFFFQMLAVEVQLKMVL